MAKYRKGHPGGPGRPRGSRNNATRVRLAISDADRTGVMRAMVKKGRGGDVPAARLMWPSIVPAGTYVTIDLPAANDAGGIAEAQARVIAAASRGQLSLEEADRLSALLENRRRAIETVDIERNLQQAQERLQAREDAEKRRRR